MGAFQRQRAGGLARFPSNLARFIIRAFAPSPHHARQVEEGGVRIAALGVQGEQIPRQAHGRSPVSQQPGCVHPGLLARGQQVAPGLAQVAGKALDPDRISFLKIEAVQQGIEVALGIKARDEPVHHPKEAFAKVAYRERPDGQSPGR